MASSLIPFDEYLFFAINHGLSNAFFDWIMPVLRNRYFWIPLYVFMAIFFIRNYRLTGLKVLVFMALTFALADFSASRIVKPSVKRLRPCNDTAINSVVITRISCGPGYSMPSSHAANHFGIACYLIFLFYRRWKWIIPIALFWAFIIGFAQIYVGVHFPLDILMGAILGCIVAYITATLFKITSSRKEWNTGNL